MTKKITAFPLRWPDGWKRTTNRKRASAYKTSFAAAYDDTLRELRLFGATAIVISTEVPINRNGRPYADADPAEPGVAVYFTRKQQPYVLACDLYDRLRWNMRAVGLAIAGLRAVERSGAAHLLDRAVAGFAALPSGAPAPQPAARPWREVMNLEGFQGPSFVMRAGIEAQYKQLARTRHPDAGGSDAAMAELNAAREEALRECSE